MDATAWTVVATGIAILAALATSFRALRGAVRDVRDRIDVQGREIAQLRERMAHLEGLLEGLREAIAGRRPAA